MSTFFTVQLTIGSRFQTAFVVLTAFVQFQKSVLACEGGQYWVKLARICRFPPTLGIDFKNQFRPYVTDKKNLRRVKYKQVIIQDLDNYKFLDEIFGWKYWMKFLDKTFGWNFWIKLLDEIFGWKFIQLISISPIIFCQKWSFIRSTPGHGRLPAW
jgi:hypothetical protein